MKNTILLFLKETYKKALQHKVISGFVVIVIVGFLYYLFSGSGATSVTYQYTTVKRGSISSVVSGTGQVTPNSQVDLKPKVNANVTAVHVKAGDRVRVGQVLFQLDGTDAYKQVRDAKTSLESAQIALEKLKNPKAIDVMTLNDSIRQEEDAKKDQDTKVVTAYKNLLNSGLEAVSEVSYTAETAPTITGTYTKGTEGQIRITVYQGGASGYSFSTTGLVTTTGPVNTSVAQPIGDTGLFIKWNSNTPQTNWIITIPNKQSSGYLSNYNSWQTAMNNRDIANAASDRTIANLTQKLADLTPGDDDLDVRSAQLQVQQKQNAYQDALQELSNYTITAPFDGVMASVTGDVGVSAVMASANSSTALGTIVTDKKMAQVVLNESDVVKVRVGQKAKVTFDAIDDFSIDGTVVEINTLGTVTSGVVTYKVKVAFDTDDVRILPNMSVAADIMTDQKDNVLYVPSQAVKHDADGYYVEKDSSVSDEVVAGSSTRMWGNGTSTNGRMFASSTASSSRFRNGFGSSTRRRSTSTVTSSTSGTTGTVVRIPVTIGIEGDTQTEITSGLREGEKIILKKTTTTTSSSASAPSITSLFRPQQQRTTGNSSGATNRTMGASGFRNQ